MVPDADPSWTRRLLKRPWNVQRVTFRSRFSIVTHPLMTRVHHSQGSSRTPNCCYWTSQRTYICNRTGASWSPTGSLRVARLFRPRLHWSGTILSWLCWTDCIRRSLPKGATLHDNVQLTSQGYLYWNRQLTKSCWVLGGRNTLTAYRYT